MNCADLKNDYAAWALGIAEDPERQEIAAHLARQCPECTQGVEEALAAKSRPDGCRCKNSESSIGLRGRVVAMVDRRKANTWIWSILPWGIVAALSVVILAIALPAQRQGKKVSKLADAGDGRELNPATRDVTFGQQPQQPKGRLFVNSSGVVFIGSNLPKLAQGKTFELWVIPCEQVNQLPLGLSIPATTYPRSMSIPARPPEPQPLQ